MFICTYGLHIILNYMHMSELLMALVLKCAYYTGYCYFRACTVHANVYNSLVLLHVHIYLCLLRMYVCLLFFPVCTVCVCTQLFDGILSTLPRQTSGGGKSA